MIIGILGFGCLSLEHLESEGRLQVAIDSILLVVLPGAVGEVPTKEIG